MYRFVLATIISLLSLVAFSENQEIEKGKEKITALETDSLVIYNYIGLADLYAKYGITDSANVYYNKAYTMLKKTPSPYILAELFNSKGVFFYNLSQFDSAIFYYEKAYQIIEKHDIDTLKDMNLTNLAGVYYAWGDFDSAIDFYEKALGICTMIKDTNGIAVNNNNIALCKAKAGKPSEAIKYFKNSLQAYSQLKDTAGIGLSYNNIAFVYNLMGSHSKARKYYEKAIKLNYELKKYRVVAASYMGIANVFLKSSQDSLTLEYLEKCIQISRKYSYLDILSEAYISLSELYEQQGYKHKALITIKDYIQIKDSINNSDYKVKIDEINNKLEKEKQKNEIIRLNAEKKVKDIELERRKLFNNLMILIVLLIVILIVIVWNRLIIKKKANKELRQYNAEINEQKAEIEAQRNHIESQREDLQKMNTSLTEINKNMVDSINYAQKIQHAILPYKGTLDAMPIKYFMLYKPKDIVSGDFFYIKKIQNRLYTAVADCTGHGVPGALMSMLSISALNEILSQNNSLSSGNVLNELRQRIIFALKQNIEGVESVKDGLDISFAIFELDSDKAMFSGANNSLFIVDNINGMPCCNTTDLLTKNNYVLREIKGDKMPVSGFADNNDFETNIFNYTTDMQFYYASDGYKDQFGGPKCKKMGIKRFRQLIIDLAQIEIEQQENHASHYFDKWRNYNNANYEQIDDICLMGLKILK